MPEEHRPLQRRTTSALIVRPHPGWIEQRYMDDVQFTEAVLMENQKAIDELAEGGPYVLLTMFPAGLQVSLPMMDKDHFRDQREANAVRAIAVVTDSAEMQTACKLYFLYHQQFFVSEVFEDEDSARTWLTGFRN